MENFSPGIFQGLLAGKGRSPLPTFSPFRTGKHWPGLSEVLQTAPTQKTGGRRTCFLRGIQKTRGRPPAGSIKGAALRILTSITQRQQGQRAPFAALCTKWKTGGIIRNAMRRAFGCLWRLTPPYAGGGCSTTRSCIAPFYVPTTRLYLFFPDCQGSVTLHHRPGVGNGENP